MGVFLSAGNWPKSATNVRSEIAAIPIKIFRRTPIIGGFVSFCGISQRSGDPAARLRGGRASARILGHSLPSINTRQRFNKLAKATNKTGSISALGAHSKSSLSSLIESQTIYRFRSKKLLSIVHVAQAFPPTLYSPNTLRLSTNT
jgi:hypothetical protein